MTSPHDFLVRRDPARLFPVLADTSKEQRATSIFLAVISQVPDLAEAILSTIGVRVGKRTTIEAYTEVELKQEVSSPGRPDGLLMVHSSRSIWTALIETKIGNAALDSDQVSKYLEMARANDIDAVITISNQFVARPDHSPVDVSKNLLRKTGLYHWSWWSISTQSEILELQKTVEDQDQVFLPEGVESLLLPPEDRRRALYANGVGLERYRSGGNQRSQAHEVRAGGRGSSLQLVLGGARPLSANVAPCRNAGDREDAARARPVRRAAPKGCHRRSGCHTDAKVEPSGTGLRIRYRNMRRSDAQDDFCVDESPRARRQKIHEGTIELAFAYA